MMPKQKVPGILHGKTKAMKLVRKAIGNEILLEAKKGELCDYVLISCYRYLLDFVFNTDPIWEKSLYRNEYICPCGVGHGNHIHGCCSKHCCSRDDFPLSKVSLQSHENTEDPLEEKTENSNGGQG